MIAALLAMSGLPTRQESLDLVLRFCVLDHEELDGEDTAAAGTALVNFFVNAYVDQEEEPLLEAVVAECEIMQSFRNAYRHRINKGLKSRGIDRKVDQEEASEAYWGGENFDPCTPMTRDLARAIGRAQGQHSASQSLSMHDHFAANR